MKSKLASMAARNAVYGAGSTSLARQGHAQQGPERGGDEQTREIRAIEITGSNIGDAPLLPESLSQIPVDVRWPRAPQTGRMIRANATQPWQTGVPTPSSRRARRQNRGSHRQQTPSPAMRGRALRNSFAVPFGENRAETTASRRAEKTMHCVKLLGLTLMVRGFERRVAELHIRAIVLSG